MSIYRTYLSKNATLINGDLSNNSRNPVTEISYGGEDGLSSRFIFDFDFTKIKQRIDDGFINKSRIKKHILKLYNTIRISPEYVGATHTARKIENTKGFTLELFNVDDDWNNGVGYDIDFNLIGKLKESEPNWYYSKTNTPWTIPGVYDGGLIFGTQEFQIGNEDISIDITDYVNDRLEDTITSFGLGLKFTDDFESLKTQIRQVVAFHSQYTNTVFEPHIETIIDDTVLDDRGFFYLDKPNKLCIYPKSGGNSSNVTVNFVTIFNNKGQIVDVIDGVDVEEITKGIYAVDLFLDSDEHVDCVNYKDVWDITVNGSNRIISDRFYLRPYDEYYTFNYEDRLSDNSFSVFLWGLLDGEKMLTPDYRKIKLTIKEFYATSNKFPLDLEYRVYTKLTGNHQIDVIPYTKISRGSLGYFFSLDLSWFIPDRYYLDIIVKNDIETVLIKTTSFTVVSDGNLTQI